jgi:hypothetical protein
MADIERNKDYYIETDNQDLEYIFLESKLPTSQTVIANGSMFKDLPKIP